LKEKERAQDASKGAYSERAGKSTLEKKGGTSPKGKTLVEGVKKPNPRLGGVGSQKPYPLRKREEKTPREGGGN